MALLVGKVLVVMAVIPVMTVYTAAFWFLLAARLAHSLLSFSQRVRFLKEVAINDVVLRGLFLQVLVREIRGLHFQKN